MDRKLLPFFLLKFYLLKLQCKITASLNFGNVVVTNEGNKRDVHRSTRR